MNTWTGRFRIRSLLGSMVLAALVFIGVGLAGCESQLAGSELAIPLSHPGSPKPTYVKGLSIAVLDDNGIALAWIEDPKKGGNGLWVCTASRNQNGALRLDGPPERVDGNVRDVTVIASGESYGLVYIQYDMTSQRLLYRWPYNAPPRTLTTHITPDSRSISESPLRSTAVADPVLGNLAFSLLLHRVVGGRQTVQLVGYVLSQDKVTRSHLATVYRPRNRLGQPPPRAILTGSSVDVGLVIAGGALVDASVSIDSLNTVPGSAGELVKMRLSVTPEHRLQIDQLRRFGLPAEPELELTSNLAILDSSMRALVTAGPKVRLVQFKGDSARVEQISSAMGCGNIYASPTVQAVGTSDSSALITWIDTDAQLSELSLAEGAYDPTVYGGEIRARLVTPQGELLSEEVPGFPIHTRAQCIGMGKLDGQLFIAWAEASKNPFSSGTPKPTALRVRFLDATGR